MKLKVTFLFSAALQFSIASVAQETAQSLEGAFKNYLQAESGRVYSGSSIPVFKAKEETKGSRYLFGEWVNGSVLGTDGTLYNNPKVQYNYDKIGQKLFMLLDSNKVIELNSGDISGFTLTGNDSTFHFERIQNTTDLNFYEPVYKKEKGYSFYKLMVTKFKRADYQTNGIIESGNKFDEYADEKQYFIVTPKMELLKINLKKKSIEKVMEAESSKVNQYFSEHKESVNELFVVNLLQYLNNQ
ncbi:MAG TPA: hypothetical protein VFQ58_05615 [Flavisolibacter sp.]|jgi:hypothetical protein|nr:hypothetical protein [Flavisolibacter sp.]